MTAEEEILARLRWLDRVLAILRRPPPKETRH